MAPIDTNVTKKGTLLMKNTKSKNGTQYTWHVTKMTSHNLYRCQESWALIKPRGHCNIETALSTKSGKKLVFQFKFGLEKCLEVFP